METHRALELVARYAPRDAENPAAPFRLGHALSSLRVARLHYELLARIRQGDAALGREDVLSELADESVRAAYGDHSEPNDSSTAASGEGGPSSRQPSSRSTNASSPFPV